MCSIGTSALAGLELLLSGIETVQAASPEPDLLPRLMTVAQRLEAVITSWTREADETGVFAASGAGSTAAWLASAAHVAPDATERRLRASRTLDELPEVADQVSRGRISTDHVTVMRSAIRELDSRQRAELEPALVDAARRTDPRTFAREARRLVAEASPDAALADVLAQQRRREAVLVRQRDGMYRLSALMPGDDGRLLQAQLSAMAQTDRPSRDERTPAQKTYDALAHLLRNASAAGGPRARILVTTKLTELTAGSHPGAVAGEFADGEPLLRAQLDRLACFAEVRRLVLDAQSVVLDAGRTRRTVTDAQYDAVIRQWGGCAGEGCDRPPAWTEIHHVEPWQYGGRTDLQNLVPLCTREHHRVHDEQQVIQLKDGRWIGPSGWADPPATGDQPATGDPPHRRAA